MNSIIAFLLLPSLGYSADMSSLDLSSNDGSTRTIVHFSITDPAGRRTGRLPGGALIEEIPGASYGTERVDPEEGPDFGEEGSQFYLRPTMAGIYMVSILAESTTSYELTVLSRNKTLQDVAPATMTLRNVIAKGATQQIQLIVDPASSNRIAYKPVIDTAPLTSVTAGACFAAALTGNTRITGPVKVNGGLTLSGNAKVLGDVTAYPVNLSGSASITGTVVQSSNSLSCFPLDLSFIRQILEMNNDNGSIPSGFLTGGALRISGNTTLTLSAGNYIVDQIELTGNSKLLVGGAVNIFVRQSVGLSGNSALGAAGSPVINLLVDSDHDQTLSAGSAQAVLYAPRARVILSGNMIFNGRLHASRVEMSGGSKVEAP